MRYRIIKLLDNWLVFWFLVALTLGWTFWLVNSASALPISYSFNGVLADGGTITGAFAFDNEAPAIATNVRNLSPNQSWGLLSSSFTIAPLYQGLPSWQASINEFCTGKCIFSATPSTTLTFGNANSTLRLGWEGATPFGNFWWQASDLRTVMPTGKISTIMVTSGTLTQHAVPLPDTFMLFLVGLAAILCFHWIARGVQAAGIATPRPPLVE